MVDSSSSDVIQFACPKCSKVIKTKKANAGKVGKCKGCDTKVRIPSGVKKTPVEAKLKTNPVGPVNSQKPAPVGVAETPGLNKFEPVSGEEADLQRKVKTVLKKETNIPINWLGFGVQMGFFVLFCLAAFLIGPIMKAFSRDSFLLHIDMGITLAALPWAAIWLVPFRGLAFWRLVMFAVVTAVFSVSLWSGLMVSDGAGPISPAEATTGVRAVPMLFLLIQIPLWFLVPARSLGWKWTNPSEEIGGKTFRILLGITVAFMVGGLAHLARFPGVNSPINWVVVSISFVMLSVVIALPAAVIILCTRKIFVTLLLSFVHMGFLASLPFLGFLNGASPRYLWLQTTIISSMVVCLYLSLWAGKFLQLKPTEQFSIPGA